MDQAKASGLQYLPLAWLRCSSAIVFEGKACMLKCTRSFGAAHRRGMPPQCYTSGIPGPGRSSSPGHRAGPGRERRSGRIADPPLAPPAPPSQDTRRCDATLLGAIGVCDKPSATSKTQGGSSGLSKLRPGFRQRPSAGWDQSCFVAGVPIQRVRPLLPLGCAVRTLTPCCLKAPSLLKLGTSASSRFKAPTEPKPEAFRKLLSRTS